MIIPLYVKVQSTYMFVYLTRETALFPMFRSAQMSEMTMIIAFTYYFVSF